METSTQIPSDFLNQIITGDCRELAKRIPDESIDLILCDPVYWQIEDYRWLGQCARRVLKPFGYCIAQIGTYYLFDGMKALGENLDYYWELSETLTYAAAFFARRIAQLHKPYMWFAKGLVNCPDRSYMIDRISSPRDKSFHEWGDGAGSFIPIIDRLTERGATVFDPFTGGGTVPAVCKMLGRNYVAFEILPDVAEKARQRVANTQPPLFVAQPEQLTLA